MLSKNLIKHIKSLNIGKYRNIHNSFLAETPKLIEEFLRSEFKIEKIICTQDWYDQYVNIIDSNIEILTVKEAELKKVSKLSTPNKVIAEIKKPKQKIILEEINDRLVLMLDDIRDPGNLGTIIRLADWYGMDNIYCSKETVDVYNPKVIQSTMGSVCRVKVHYSDLQELIPGIKEKYTVYASTMDGNNIYQEELPERSAIIIGNEANGVSEEILSLADKKIAIPTFRKGAESLNASIAAGILVSEFFR